MITKRTGSFLKLAIFVTALLAVCLFLRAQPNEIQVFRFSKLGTTVTDVYFVTRKTDIVITAPAGAKVYYTTDGTTPDESAMLYTEPLVLEPASGDFPNCLLLKAVSCYADGTKSAVETHTFFAHTQMQSLFENMVISISADPAQLTDGPDGILYGENVWLRGEQSERKVYVETVSAGGKLIFEQNAGARVYGMLSRRGSIQSIKLFARKDYDKNHGKFNLDSFGTLGHDNQVIDRYDRLVLRNSSNSEYDFWCGFFRDELNQGLIEQAGNDNYQRTLPAVVYLNGKYYGFFWLHENYCDDFLKEKYGGEAGRFEIIEGSEQGKTVDEADPEKAAAAGEFNEIYSKFASADLTDDNIYAELTQHIDIEDYLKYFAYNIYVNNVDWPHNNYKCYRYYGDEKSYTEGSLDGRWRFLYHDLDYTMGNYGKPESSAEYNMLAELLSSTNRRYAPLFANLLKRADCREFFLTEIVRLRDTVLTAQNVIAAKNAMAESRAEEMKRFFKHFQELETSVGTVEDAWATYEKSLERIDTFILKRAECLQTHLIEAFDLPQNYFGTQ